MTTEQKKEIIWKIIRELKNQAILHNKPFDGGDLFFSLVFMTDKELNEIASACRIR